MTGKYTNKLQNQRVLVIGGTSGIGFAVAEGAVDFGAHVIVASSKQENVDKTVKNLKETYPEASDRIEGHVCDYNATDLEAEVAKILDLATKDKTLLLDHIVDTAGTVGAGRLSIDQPGLSQVDQLVAARAKPKLAVAKAARAYVKDSYVSSLTFTSGALAFKPRKGFGITMAVLSSGDSLAKSLAVELAPIRVNVVVPGAIHTPLLEKFAPNGDLKGLLETFSTASLVGRVGQPEDVAECYLAAIKSGFQTGTVVHCEGGYYLV